MIKFEDIIPIQSDEKAFALRIVYESAKSKEANEAMDEIANKWNLSADDAVEDWPTLSLKIEQADIDPKEYKPFHAGIIKDIIEKMDEIASHRFKLEEGWDGFQCVSTITQAGSKIAITTRRGAGNFVLLPEDIYEGIKKFGVGVVGNRLNGMEMCPTPHLKDKLIVGYKGPGGSDSGLILHVKDEMYQLFNFPGAGRYYVSVEV